MRFAGGRKKATVRPNDGAMIAGEGDGGGGSWSALVVVGSRSAGCATPRIGIGDEVDGMEPYQAGVVQDEELAGQEIAADVDKGIGVAAWDLIVGGVDRDDVVIGDLAHLSDHERVAQGLIARGKSQGPGICVPARLGRLLVERLVWPEVVLVVEEVLEPEFEGHTAVIDVGGAQAAQYRGDGGLVEALDLAVALGIGRGAQDEVDVEGQARAVGVVGLEASTVIEEE